MKSIHFVSNGNEPPPKPNGFLITDNIENADLVIAYGGDGTVLHAFKSMSAMGLLNIPLLGINKGTLGFLSNDLVQFKGDGYKTVIDMVLGSDIVFPLFDHRSLIDVETDDGRKFKILNDLTIHPNDIGRLASVDMRAKSLDGDGGSVTLKGDGLIVSTPTGSTAYNLSAGGPILMPYMRNMVVTPLNPFTMSGRSIVLGEGDEVILTNDSNLRIAVDGMEIKGSPKVRLKLSQDKLILVRTTSFFEAIQNKLGWNRSIK